MLSGIGCNVRMRKRPFGNAGVEVTQVGLGGEGVLRTYERTPDAVAVIEKAADQGIAYFDSAMAYAGSQKYYGSFWKKHSHLRDKIFQTSKSANRDKDGARDDLVHSLAAMGLRDLDLWQIHDIRTREDINMIESPGGALEAFIEAKETGLTRFIGVTGHHDPSVLKHAVVNWPVDAVLLPVNPVEAIIGMKVLGASHYIHEEAEITPELLIRFALSQEITTAIVGCSTPREVQMLAQAGRDFEPVSEEEQKVLMDLFRHSARKLAFYRGVL